MPVKSRDMPAAARPRPQRKRGSRHFKKGFTAAGGAAIKDMKAFPQRGERGMSEVKPQLKAPARTQPDNKTYVQKLNPWHRKLARAKLMGNLSITQLARKFNRSRTAVGKVCSSPVFKKYYEMLEGGVEDEVANIRMDLRQMASRAVENLDEDIGMTPTTLEHRKVRQMASKDVLDRAGFARTPVPTSGGGNQLNIQMNVINKMSDDELWDHADKMLRNFTIKKSG